MTTTTTRRLLKSLPLTRHAAAGLKDAVSCDDIERFHANYADALAKPIKRLRKLLRGRSLLAGWSENELDLSPRERELAAAVDEAETSKPRKRQVAARYQAALDGWLSDLSGPLGLWESIAIPEILLREAWQLTAESFVSALAVFVDSMRAERSGSAGALPSRHEQPSGLVDDAAALDVMLQDCELPRLTRLLLSPFGTSSESNDGSEDALAKILTECSDDAGLLHGSLLTDPAMWLAPVARWACWSHVLREPHGAVEGRLRAIVERATMLMLPAQHEAEAPQHPELADVLGLLLDCIESPHDRRLRRLLKDCRKSLKAISIPKQPKPQMEKPGESEAADAAASETSSDETSSESEKSSASKLNPSAQSDVSCVAVLRSSVKADADLITVNWSSSQVQLMLAAAGVPIINGEWSWSVRVDDQPLSEPMDWKCSCWYLDRDAVFIELEGPDNEDVKRVRQVLLAPCDRFAMLTDSVTTRDPNRRVQLTSSLPLLAGTAAANESITRELQLSTGPRLVRTFPLWLEDDRIQHVYGSYQEHDGQLEVSAIGQGGVTVPLALDWHPKRRRKPADWSRLTVVENRRTVGSHKAAGYRVRIGDHQVLLYRSLLKPAISRSVLGLHCWDETVYSRIGRGKLPMWHYVEVESR